MDFSRESMPSSTDLWVVDLGLISQVGPIPDGAVHSPGPGDFGPDLSILAGWGGAALALAGWKITSDPRLALAVGRSVRAGQATASRASVIGRSPLTGTLSQAQVGTDLARRLGSLCDGLLLAGESKVPDAVLVLRAGGAMRLERVEGIRSMDTRRSAQVLRERFGDGAVLRAGPAAHAGVRWSNLCAGQEPASFVGSGGMGFVLAGTGLGAVMICAEPVESEIGDDGWLRSLVSSPRLIARAQGQSLQEADRDPNPPKKLERHGCEGCPTPCGFVFERPDRSKGNARFSALRPLMDLVGDPDGHGLQALLQACNDLGVDAREAAACLQAMIANGAAVSSDLPSMLRGFCLTESAPAAFRLGSVRLAEHFGGSAPPNPGPVGRRAHTPEPAFRLAGSLGVRGTEPLRSYPFLVGQHTEAMRMRSLVAPMELPPGSEDPDAMEGKGRLLWWHENLICGVDVLGVCAFTVSALLSDGVSDLVGLATRILPEHFQVPGAADRAEALLAVGANTLWLFRQVDFEGRPTGFIQESLPAELVEQGREYLSLRGLRGDGGPAQDPGIRLGRAEWTRTPASMRTRGGRGTRALDPGDRSGDPTRIGVEFKFQGALGPRLGEGLCLWLEGGATLVQALEAVSQLFPRTGHWLISDGKPVPAVLRGGQVLQGSSPLGHGDVLELVLAISGG